MKLKEIQDLLLQHLKESIDIRKNLDTNTTDLTWIKKAMWVLATAGIGFNVTLVLYLLRVR